MSLKQFHLVFIVVCALFCVYFTAWASLNYLQSPAWGPMAYALGGLLSALGLGFYGFRVKSLYS